MGGLLVRTPRRSSSSGQRAILLFTAMNPPLCCACCPHAAVLAIGGVGGLAVGLAGREILENLFTGLIILSSNPFEVRQCLSVCFVVVAVVLRPCLPACLAVCWQALCCTAVCRRAPACLACSCPQRSQHAPNCCLPSPLPACLPARPPSCRWEMRCCSAPPAGRWWRALWWMWDGTAQPSAPLSARSTTSQTQVGGWQGGRLGLPRMHVLWQRQWQ